MASNCHPTSTLHCISFEESKYVSTANIISIEAPVFTHIHVT